jgi:hypothetical protein
MCYPLLNSVCYVIDSFGGDTLTHISFCVVTGDPQLKTQLPLKASNAEKCFQTLSDGIVLWYV